MDAIRVLVIGGGAFGSAMAHLARENGHVVQVIDKGEIATENYPVVILAVPVAGYRQALIDNRAAFSDETIVLSCAKGIEKRESENTLLLPHEIFKDTQSVGKYHALSGPSFAREIIEGRPTVVDCASVDRFEHEIVLAVLARPYFALESHDSVFEIELAGAVKNVYAIAAGFAAGLGGGANTQAHLQVVALREYQTLARALLRDVDVVRPSIVGDLLLTCGSTESRNYRYGFERAQGNYFEGVTVEGAQTVFALLSLSARSGVSLPLAGAVQEVVEKGRDAREAIMRALGF